MAVSSRSIWDFESHTLNYGELRSPETGACLDEVLVAVMKAPRSYTREDIVEFHCHGSPLVLRLGLEALIRNGARLAEPGEFTKRAFLNGRLDLRIVFKEFELSQLLILEANRRMMLSPR